MNRVGKSYRLRNGYEISKCECYNGYQNTYFWCVFAPNGDFYKNCGSYEEAYKCASSLKAKEEN